MVCVVCMGVVVAFMGCAGAPMGQMDLAARARSELAAESSESDVAVILPAAIDRASRAAPSPG